MPKKHCRSLDDWLDRAWKDGMDTMIRIGKPPGLKSGTAKELKNDVLSKAAGRLLAIIEDIRTKGAAPEKVFEAGRILGQLEVMTESGLLQEIATAVDLAHRRKVKGRGKTDVQPSDKEIIAKTTEKLRPDLIDSQIAQRLRDEWERFGLSRQFGTRTLLKHMPK